MNSILRFLCAIALLSTSASGSAQSVLCSLERWSSTVGQVQAVSPLDGPAFSRVHEPCALYVPTTGSYVQDDTPGLSPHHSARFYVKVPAALAGARDILRLVGTGGAIVRVSIVEGSVRLLSGAGTVLVSKPFVRGVWNSIVVRFSAGAPGSVHLDVGTYVSSSTGGTIQHSAGTAQLYATTYVQSVQLGQWTSGAAADLLFDSYISRDDTQSPALVCRCDTNGDNAVNVFDTSAITAETLYGATVLGNSDCNLDGSVNVFDRTIATAKALNNINCPAE